MGRWGRPRRRSGRDRDRRFGNIYFTDVSAQLIRRIGTDGMVSTLAGNAFVRAHGNGWDNAAEMSGPSGIAVDPAGEDLFR